MVERLLIQVSKLQYPSDKLEIQVLDDSTDDSVIQTSKLVHQIAQTGIV